jgi:hypothetical protein
MLATRPAAYLGINCILQASSSFRASITASSNVAAAVTIP